MDLVQVKIKTTVVTSQYGTLVSGDILRTSDAFARHLVEDCKAAEFIAPQIEKPKKAKKGTTV